jgi:aminoglycoside phosphotransferase (APT) family kinase protein
MLREKVVRPKTRRAIDVPTRVEAITTGWLTDVLCRDHPDAQVTGFEIRFVSRGTQARHRILVEYDEAGRAAGLPTSIFVKSLPSFVTRMVAGFNGQARVEAKFYSTVRRLLEIEAPKGYHSAYDRDAFTAIHLLEDLVATKGAIFCDWRTPVTRAMAEDMVDLLATLHGRFYEAPELTRTFRWLADYSRWFAIGCEKMETARYSDKAFVRAADRIPVRLLARKNELWPATLRATAIHESGPKTFLHSDVHIGNWYRTGAGRMGLCDWQCPSRGHWSRDFAYAVTAALTVEDRRAWDRELLRRYLDRLSATVGRRFEFDEAWTLYRQQIFHALSMWTITLCHSPLLPAMQPEAASLAMIERMTWAIADLDALDAFTAGP